MGDEARRRQRHVDARLAQQHRLAVDRIELEEPRVTPLQPGNAPLLGAGLPDDLGDREALADGVEDIDQLVLEGVALHEIPDEVGGLDVAGLVARSVDGDLEARHLTLPDAQDAEVMQVALLHVLR